MAQFFILLDFITDEKTVKLIQLDTIVSTIIRGIPHQQVPTILVGMPFLVYIP